MIFDIYSCTIICHIPSNYIEKAFGIGVQNRCIMDASPAKPDSTLFNRRDHSNTWTDISGAPVRNCLSCQYLSYADFCRFISSNLILSSLIYSNDSQMSKSARSIIQYPGFDEFFVFIICQMIHTRREIPNPVNIQRTIPSTIATMAGLAQAVASFIHRGYHSIPPESISSFSSISVIWYLHGCFPFAWLLMYAAV